MHTKTPPRPNHPHLRLIPGAPVQKQSIPYHLYQFDEGTTVTFEDGTLGIGILGGTGRGKTESFVAPMSSSLIGAGFPGLIIDVKNNFTDTVRRLAAAAGRSEDIVELGTHPSATPINALAGLSYQEMEQVLHSLILAPISNGKSGNMDFAWRGYRLATDLVWLLDQLRGWNPLFTPSFALLDRCVNDYAFSGNLFNLFLNNVFDPDQYEHVAFQKQVTNDEFHIFTPKDKRQTKAYYEQLGYRLSYVRAFLNPLVKDPAILENFSAPGGIALNYRDLLARNKIVLIRFKAGQGGASQILARFAKEKFFQDVYRLLDDGHRPQSHLFFIGDEFQDIMTLERDNPFDDFSWFSKSREFGCINIIASQSLSSLYACGQKAAVDALFTNCSTKIVLQNDDPAADAFFRHFCGIEKTLAQLGPGEALVSRYDFRMRQHNVNHLHYDKAYQHTRALQFTSLSEQLSDKNGGSISEHMRFIDRILIDSSRSRLGPFHKELYERFSDILIEDETTIFIKFEAEQLEEVYAALEGFRERFTGKAFIKDIMCVLDRIYLGVEEKGLPQKLLYEIEDYALEVMTHES